MVRAVVALGTQKRCTRLEQRRDVGTVRGMAVGAVFGHRLMFPQEGAAFFGMAGEASLIDRVFLEQFRTGRAMGIMTIRAHYFAFTDRVMRNFVALRTLFLVAGEADFGLRLLVAHLVVRRVNFVARGTRHVASLVGATLPVSPFCILIVTGKTGIIQHFRFGRCEGAFLENNVRRCFAFLRQVVLTLAVARLATRGTGISLDAMLGLVDRQYRFLFTFVMALRAHCILVQDRSSGFAPLRRRVRSQ